MGIAWSASTHHATLLGLAPFGTPISLRGEFPSSSASGPHLVITGGVGWGVVSCGPICGRVHVDSVHRSNARVGMCVVGHWLLESRVIRPRLLILFVVRGCNAGEASRLECL